MRPCVYPQITSSVPREFLNENFRVPNYQELMSHLKGGEGAFNYVVTALSKVLAVL